MLGIVSYLFSNEIKYGPQAVKQENIDKKLKTWYYQRLYNSDWPLLAQSELVTSQSLLSQTNLLSTSTVGKKLRARFGTEFIDKIKLTDYPIHNFYKKFFISDLIMFNQKFKLDYFIVDRLLSFILIRHHHQDHHQFDGWHFEQLTYGSLNGPSYRIYYDDSNVDLLNENKSNEESDITSHSPMQLISSDYDKFTIARCMLQVMNESPDEFVNFHNYHVLGQWVNDQEYYIKARYATEQCYNFELKSHQEIMDKVLQPSDLKLHLNGRITLNELLAFLYNHAINGHNDLTDTTVHAGQIKEYIMNVYGNLQFNQLITDLIYDKSDFSSSSSLIVHVNTYLNNEDLDLTNYYQLNGKIHTINLLQSLKNYIEFRWHCRDLPAEYVLVGLYQCPISDRICESELLKPLLSLDEARYLLNTTSYFDYINGRRFKMHFDTYPILDYDRYERTYGTCSFESAIKYATKLYNSNTSTSTSTSMSDINKWYICMGSWTKSK